MSASRKAAVRESKWAGNIVAPGDSKNCRVVPECGSERLARSDRQCSGESMTAVQKEEVSRCFSGIRFAVIVGGGAPFAT